MERGDGLRLRTACPEDGERLVRLYAPYVRETAVTFEYEAPSAEEFSSRIRETLKRYPYFVAEWGGEPVGYAYASPFHTRAAYQWAAETSVYVKQGLHGKGVGKALYKSLEDALRKQNVQNVNACITYPNEESIRFHEKLGYRTAARFSKCGFKLGRWWDMVWMEKFLGGHDTPPVPFVPFPELRRELADTGKT